MTRCKHRNVDLDEVGTAVIQWCFEDGEISYSHASDPQLTGAIVVACRDCGGKWRLPARAPRPAWVSKLCDTIYKAVTEQVEDREEVYVSRF